MNTRGFKQYNGLVDVSFVDSPAIEQPKKDVNDPAERVLSLIFAKDKFGWPNTSVEVMLSPKTSEEVRTFISQNILVARDRAHLINDDKMVSEFNKLEGSFIAQCSRNRYESLEDYEKRLSSIVEDGKVKASFDAFIQRLNDSK